MNIARRLLRIALLVPLLAACSLGSDPPPEVSNPTPTARPVDAQSDVSINGRLLFVQGGNLYLQQGTATRQITSDGLTRDPVWAPDGSRIAYVRREESYSDLFVLSSDGGLPTQVTFNRGPSEPWTQEFMHQVVWATNPSWTPDGSAITFLSQIAPPEPEPELYEYPLSVYNYQADLIGQRQPTNDDLLVRLDNTDVQRPVWSPDQAYLALVRVPRDNSPMQIMVYDANTGSTDTFPGIPDNSYDPAWSPDGRWLAFAAKVDGQTDVWAIPSPAIGGSAVRLTTIGNSRAPEWSPDGSQIAFIHLDDDGSDVFVMPVTQDTGISAGEPQQVTNGGQVDANSGLSWSE